MKKIIRINKWNLLFFAIAIVLTCSLFVIEGIINDANKDNLTVYQNVFIGFIACDITIISIFFGAFIPLLVGNVKENIPLKYYEVIKKDFFNVKKLFFVGLMLIIHVFQLIGCIYSFHYEPIIIFIIISTTLYFLWIFLNSYQIYSSFNYGDYFLRQIKEFSKMIKKDILKKKISKREKNKYSKKINFIIDAFPENKNHFNELGNLKIKLGTQLYYFTIDIFSKGLFLYERFNFFKGNIYTQNFKYLKDEDAGFNYEINIMEDILMDKLVFYYSLFDNNELNEIFDNILIIENTVSFDKLSYYGMSFLTKLHIKLSNLKNWRIDITWIIFLSIFIEKNMELVILEDKKQLKCHSKKTAKKFVIDNIHINPGLYIYYWKICNDKKALKKDFDSNAFQMLHSYIADQSLFGIGKYTLENKKNILQMLSLDNYKNQKFVFNKDVISLSNKIKNLTEYVEQNKKMKKEFKMFWVNELRKILESSQIKVTKKDIKNIQFEKYDEISDFLVEEVTKEILNSKDLLNQNVLKEWTDKLYDYFLSEIKRKKNEFLLYNFSNYIINFPRPLLQLFNNLLRVQLSIYQLDSENYKNTTSIILNMKKQGFLKTNYIYEDDLAKFIDKKFKLIKNKCQSSKQFTFPYKIKWFELFLLNTEDEIRKEKIKWENEKKSK